MRVSAGAVLFLTTSVLLAGQTSERLTYDVEWRLIHAGTVVIEAQKTAANMKLDSGGMVSTLFKVHDLYSVTYNDAFCAAAASLDSQEGKRHHDTRVSYDAADHRATYLERDLVRNSVLRSDSVQIPPCVHDVLTGFMKLRTMNYSVGQTLQIPMSDGRRSASVKLEAQEREEIKTPAGDFKTVRVEANMLNGVVYSRRGRVFLWLTDDERHVPVQIRLRMNFPVGTVTLQLAKEEKL